MRKTTVVENQKEGCLRLRKVFCWFYTPCEDGISYWLEYVYVLEKTKVVERRIPETTVKYNTIIWCEERYFGKDIPYKYLKLMEK